MKKLFLVVSFVMMVLLLDIGCARAVPVAKARLIISVVDDEGKPVPGVHIDGGGWIPGRYGAALIKTTTDKNGMADIVVKTASAVDYFFKKEGYYESRVHRNPPGDPVKGYWQPNPMEETVVLKRIKNPVPMYVKGVDAKVPVLGKPVGYDLMAGDWVAPYGKGAVADFIISVTGEYKSFHDREMRLNVLFSNDKDGIQSFKSLPLYQEKPLGSEFWSSHEAPLEGYEPVYDYERISSPDGTNNKNVLQRKDLNFYFRVRTEIDERGNIKKAMYGKIYRDFYCYYDHFKSEFKVKFWYYLNPDWTRNMEADTKKNLFGVSVNVGIKP